MRASVARHMATALWLLIAISRSKAIREELCSICEIVVSLLKEFFCVCVCVFVCV